MSPRSILPSGWLRAIGLTDFTTAGLFMVPAGLGERDERRGFTSFMVPHILLDCVMCAHRLVASFAGTSL